MKLSWPKLGTPKAKTSILGSKTIPRKSESHKIWERSLGSAHLTTLPPTRHTQSPAPSCSLYPAPAHGVSNLLCCNTILLKFITETDTKDYLFLLIRCSGRAKLWETDWWLQEARNGEREWVTTKGQGETFQAGGKDLYVDSGTYRTTSVKTHGHTH